MSGMRLVRTAAVEWCARRGAVDQGTVAGSGHDNTGSRRL